MTSRPSHTGLLAVALSAFAAACASTEPGPAVDVPTEDAPVVEDAGEAAVAEPELDLGTRVTDELPSPTAPKTLLSGFGLALWQDDDFKRWFMDSYSAVTDVEPQVTIFEQEFLEDVAKLFAEDDVEAAEETLRSLRGASASAAIDFTLGNALLQQGKLEEAGEAYTVATTKFPRFRRAWNNLGVVRVQLEDWPGAVKALAKAISLGANEAVTYGLLGVAYATEERDLAAESALRMAMLLDGDTEAWQLWLARSLFRQERFADAAALCENLIANNPSSPTNWVLQANALVGLGKPLQAAQNFEVAHSLGGATTGTLNNLGNIYTQEKIYDQAALAYVQAMQLSEDAPVSQALLAARVMAGANALDEAQQVLASIDELRGDDLAMEDRKGVLRLRAQMALVEGGGEAEARILEEVVALDPLDGQAILQLGVYESQQGNPEKAVFYFERAARLEGFEADAHVRHAQLLVGQERFAEAVPLLERAQQIDARENVQTFLEQIQRRARGGS